jgi:hypothetical protein
MALRFQSADLLRKILHTTHIPSFVHHAIPVPKLVGLRPDSNLPMQYKLIILISIAHLLTRIKQNQSVRSNEIYPTAACFGTEQEDELFAIRVIELIDKFLSLGNRHRSV